MVVITGIATGLEQPREEAIEKAIKELGLEKGEVQSAHIVKTSVDARRRGNIRFIHSVGIVCAGEAALVEKLARPNVTRKVRSEHTVAHGERKMANRPVVVGFGPGGMFAALLLARQGYRPLVLERGSDVDTRTKRVEQFWRSGELDTNSNVQFGEGGAGTFSDGKLTTRIGDPRCDLVLEALACHGAPEEILYKAKPHVGTDILKGVVRSIREEIVQLGGEVRFDTAVTGLRLERGKVVAVRTSAGEEPCDDVVFAIGHSARDTFGMLGELGVEMTAKPFSVGVRIEQLQTVIDKGLYGELAGHPALPVGEYQLSHRQDGRAVYTFCMCPGGFVVPAASEEGGVVTNGMSEHDRGQPNANSALVVSVSEADYGAGWQAGIAFQQKLEQAAFVAGGNGYRAPVQTADRFLEGKPGAKLVTVAPSYQLGVMEADFAGILPAQVVEHLKLGLRQFGCKLPGFASGDAVLTGVETRTSSPVRIVRREDTLEAPVAAGLYPCGEGAGYAGGIVSAAVDGLRVAEQICAKYRKK